MNYYSMCHEVVEGGYTDGDVVFYPPLSDYYQIGMSLSLTGVSVSVVLDKKVRALKSDYFLTTSGAFFVSQEFKEVLGGLNTNLQFSPADVKHSNGKPTVKKYYFIHDNDRCACFDYGLSEYSGKSLVMSKIQAGELAADYKVRGVKKMCIDEAKTGSLDLFFVAGVIWIDPIVSEVLVRKVESNKLLVRFSAIG
ncbi:imm11 family protein [Pseudomonas sp. S1(2024)]|uniref:imm11 family protein n=1 Tax=Pseudomonas sp. S1(2024) TaxID=3390191 RepID=UPI00397BED7A